MNGLAITKEQTQKKSVDSIPGEALLSVFTQLDFSANKH